MERSTFVLCLDLHDTDGANASEEKDPFPLLLGMLSTVATVEEAASSLQWLSVLYLIPEWPQQHCLY